MPRRTLFSLLRPGTNQAADWEIRHHIEEKIDRLVDEGWDPDDARREAERRFGDRSRYRAELVSLGTTDDGRRWIVETFESIAQDVRQALRTLRKHPGFAWTLVLTLALGIGATGAVFSVIDAVLLRPLPYAEPERLAEVSLNIVERETVIPGLRADQVEAWMAGADFFEQTARLEHAALVRTDGPEPEQLGAMAVSAGLDEVLGVQARLGRTFVPEDEAPGARVVMLTHAYWMRDGGDPGVVGRDLRLGGEPWTVIGVLPRGFKYPIAGTAQIWIPLASDLTAAGLPVEKAEVVGRLPQGTTLAAAQERADALGEALQAEQPHRLGWTTRLEVVGEWRANPAVVRGLWTAGGAVALMLLIALVNALNLLLVRAQTRRPEVGVRQAMGASRKRLVRHALVESVVLALLGGAMATAFAWLGVEGIRAIAPTELTFGMVHEFGLEARSLALVFLAAMGAGLVVGLLPALHLARSDSSMGGTVRTRGLDRRAHRIRSLLVTLEVAVSVVLLVGAGLFLRSFAGLQRVDLGLDVDRVAVVEVALPEARYPTADDRAAFVRSLVARLDALPGVVHSAASQGIPPDGGGISFGLELEPEGGEPRPYEGLVPFNRAAPGYFEALGTDFVDGRLPVAADVDVRGVVIDRELARLVFDDERVAGRRFRLDGDGNWLTVVGVVRDLRLSGPDDQYGPASLVYVDDFTAPPGYLSFVVRTAGDPAAVLPGMRDAVRGVDPELPLRTLQTAEAALADALVRPRFLVLLISVLAGVALVLAAVGIFGVLAYAVSQRRREMGIRMALGARATEVRGGVMRWGLGLALVGTGAGLVVASLVDDVAATLLYAVDPGDPLTRVGVAATMVLVAATACWIPAVRATRVDPVEVLREE